MSSRRSNGSFWREATSHFGGKQRLARNKRKFSLEKKDQSIIIFHFTVSHITNPQTSWRTPILEAPRSNHQIPFSSTPRRRRNHRSGSETVACRSPSQTLKKSARICRIGSNAAKRRRLRRRARVWRDRSHCGLLLRVNLRLLTMIPPSFPKSNLHFFIISDNLIYVYVCVFFYVCIWL